MKSDLIIRAFREQPEVWASFQAIVAERREALTARVAGAATADDLFRLQGELRALTNLVSYFKTALGNANARTREETGRIALATRNG